MARGSYEPRDALRFWEKMVAANANRAQPLAWMSTHPANEERLAALRELV